MTYKNCKLLINITVKKVENGTMSEAEFGVWSADMTNNMDILLLNKRITGSEYNELMGLIEIKGA